MNIINNTILTFQLGRGIMKIQSSNVISNKYEDLNKVLIKQYVNYYLLCWKYRNEIAHDEDK